MEILTQKEFVYDDNTLQEAVAIMEQTVFRKKKLLGYLGFGVVFGLPCLAGVILERKPVFLLYFLIFMAFPVLLRNSFRKEFIKANSLEEGEKMWSPQRTITVTEEAVTIWKPYLSEKPEEYDTDPEYRAFHDEMDAEMSRECFPLEKIRVYESEKIFLIYRNRDKNQAVAKKFLTENEILQLQEFFSEKLGKRYLPIQTASQT